MTGPRAFDAGVVALAGVGRLEPEAFRRAVLTLCTAGGRLAALWARPPRDGRRDVFAFVADDAASRQWLVATNLPVIGGAYPSLTALLPEAQALERGLLEDTGIVPEGHPWPKPLRRHADLDRGAPEHSFFRVEGIGVHEVAVGPVHAGIIEPGHFRFQCHGEVVFSLEIQLGYQHRGARALLLSSTPARRLAIAESIAGDTAVGHALAHCQALEALSGAEPPLAAQAIRAVALELERLANHVGDLGALCNDVGFLPGASWFGRMRGDFLNLLLELSGNRFGRGLVIPGGVRFGLDPDRARDFVARLERADRDLADTAEVVFETPSVVSRFEHTGIVSKQSAESLGLVGPTGRASGCDRDVRRDHPSGLYRYALVPVSLADSGDVMARALVRWFEVRRSLRFLREELPALPRGPLSVPLPAARPDACALGHVEGWRGEIVHAVTTDANGALDSVEIVDPSLHNWFGLAMALRDNQISDFPLCNKSFNLSYAGYDL